MNLGFNQNDRTLLERCTWHSAGQKVFAAGLGQLGSIVLGVHAGIGDKHGATQIPAAQIGADLLVRGDIGGVAGEDSIANLNTVAGNGKGNHNLGCPESFLGVPILPERRIGMLVGVIFGIDGKRGGGCVVEDQVDVEVEQICGVEKDSFLHLCAVLVEKIHRFIHMVLLQFPGPPGGRLRQDFQCCLQ